MKHISRNICCSIDVYVFSTGLQNNTCNELHLLINPRMAMNYYAIQIFHSKLKVKILKYDVNHGRQQQIITEKSTFLLEYVTRDSTSKQKNSKNKRNLSPFDN